MKLKEAASGSGGLCGGTFVDRLFEQFIRNKFKDNDDFDDECLRAVNGYTTYTDHN